MFTHSSQSNVPEEEEKNFAAGAQNGQYIHKRNGTETGTAEMVAIKLRNPATDSLNPSEGDSELQPDHNVFEMIDSSIEDISVYKHIDHCLSTILETWSLQELETKTAENIDTQLMYNNHDHYEAVVDYFYSGSDEVLIEEISTKICDCFQTIALRIVE